MDMSTHKWACEALFPNWGQMATFDVELWRKFFYIYAKKIRMTT
jgi:hypothetical protein